MEEQEQIQLNENQIKAVKHKPGPVLVVAGAGTGKTRVITERIRYLIEEKGTDPQEILALTFTEKASQEMLSRIGDIMPLGYEEPWVYTFHSFADRILRERGIEIGLDPSFKIISTSDQWLLLRKHIFDMKLKYFRPMGKPTKFISAILSFISKLQDENISQEELSKYIKQTKFESDEEKIKWEELSYIYTYYEGLKIENSLMDFGNLIMWLIKMFRMRPNLLNEYKNKFKHILIDEFQDTNYAQYELIKLLFPIEIVDNHRSLLAVGDDSQSIYKFRGAAISNILQFRNDYKDSDTITLLKNYRSTQKILDAAYELIQNNNPDTLESKLGISKKLVSANIDLTEDSNAIPDPEILKTQTLEQEIDTVIQKIIELVAEEDYTYKDFAILARANNHLDPVIMTLRKYGLPYQLVGNRGLYDRDEVRDIIAFLKIIIDTSDGISLFRVINTDSLEIPYEEISDLLSQSRFKKTDLWDQIKESENERVKFFVKIVEEFQKKITKATPVEMVFELVNKINYLSQFLEEETIENELCIKNLNLFLQKVQKFEVNHHSETKEMPTIIDLIDYLDVVMEAGENPAQAEIEDIDTINLMTVHSAKGLEFPVVFMINLISGRFPTRNRKDLIQIPEGLIKETLPTGDEHIQEERRLFYVGMTRAKKYLYMTLGKNYGGKRDTIPTGYLGETGLEIKEMEGNEEEKRLGSFFQTERQFKEPKIIRIEGKEPEYISYSQIDNYLVCPLRYKFSYTLKVPTPPNCALSFGNTIHETLKDFHTQKMFGKNPTIDDLLKSYEKNWIPLGYDNEKHRKLRYEDGIELLKKYYETNKNLDVKHIGLEKNFVLDIGDIKLRGKIDRIDQHQDGRIEIIDYKTGQEKTQKEVDDDVQMTIYTMAAREALKINPDTLSLYYFEPNVKISTNRTQKQVDAQKEIIKDVVKGIKDKNFEATPGRHCTWCDYKDICPFAEKS